MVNADIAGVIYLSMQSWIPATSMDGGSAEEDMEFSLPIPAGMTAI